MPDQLSTFESHRDQLAASLNAVAESMRNCAQMADSFAKVVGESTYSPETAEALQGALDGFTKGKRKAAHSPEDDDAPKKRKRNVKPKDVNAPKRPASSYIIFQNQIRKTLKETHPELSNAELLKMISAQWTEMTPDQKAPYNKQMEDLKTQYEAEKKTYENRSPEQVEADNAAAAQAAIAKKANAKPRGPKKAKAAAAAATESPVKARPPPTADQIAATDDSDEDQSDDEDTAEPDHAADSDNSDEDDEEASPEPAPVKKRRSPSAQPKEHKRKHSKA